MPMPGGDDVVGPAPIGEDCLGVEIAGAVEHAQKSLLVFERGVVGGKPLAREHCREQAVARRVADMQRLGHRAEIGLDAGRERGGDRQRLRGFRAVQTHQ